MAELCQEEILKKGRFAPSPTGRMHLGNIYTAVLSWLDVKSCGGKWILRHEDLDPQRSKPTFARQIEDDLRWLGLDWDEGGLDNIGPNGPYSQSLRSDLYEEALRIVKATGMCYPCYCTRADLRASSAPHLSDGRVIYSGKCCPENFPCYFDKTSVDAKYAVRLHVPDRVIGFEDGVYGAQMVNLAEECGDFVLRRADGAWAYQLAVVVDDALMGVNSVVRGADLLLSAAQQIYIYELLGLSAPRYTHLPLICNSQGVRLSKRDSSLSMEALRAKHTPEELIGLIAYLSGQQPDASPISARDLLSVYTMANIPRRDSVIFAD